MEILEIIAFIGLALYWYNTGNFFIIGWIVKILWLPINILCVFLWIAAVFINRLILDFIRNNYKLKIIVFGALIWACYYANIYEPTLFIFSIICAVIFSLLIIFGINEDLIKAGIFYLPSTKRTPIKKIKKPKARKPEKQKSNPVNEKKQKHEALPVVQILATDGSKFETEREIISKLPQHLKDLMGVTENEQE